MRRVLQAEHRCWTLSMLRSRERPTNASTSESSRRRGEERTERTTRKIAVRRLLSPSGRTPCCPSTSAEGAYAYTDVGHHDGDGPSAWGVRNSGGQARR